MRRILIITFISFIISLGYSDVYAQPDHDSVKAMLRISNKHIYSSPDTSIMFAKKALTLAITQKDTGHIVWAYNSLGSAYWVKADYVASLDYFQKLITIGKLTKDDMITGRGYGNAAVISIDIEDLEPAMQNSVIAYSIYKKIGDTTGMATSLNNIGIIHDKLGQYDSALHYFERGYDLWTLINDNTFRGLAQSNISNIYTKQKNVKKAIKHGVIAMQLSEKEGNIKSLGHAYISLSKAFILQGKTDIAISYALKALKIAEPKGIIEIIRDAHQQLYIGYSKQKKNNIAFKQLKEYTALKDSMVNSNKLKLINHLQTRVRFEQKNKQIAEQEKQLVISESARQRNLLLLIGAGILLCSIIIVSYQIYRKQKLKIKAKNQQIQMEQQELMLAELSLKNEQLVNKDLKTELDFKKQELLSYTLITTEKNQLLQDLNKQIDTLSGDNSPKDIRKIKNTINAAMGNKENWEEFKTRFEQVHVTFFDTLKALYPQLSANDLRLCAFIKLSLSSKQIASLLNIAPSSVDISKYRLKKKFDLEKDEQLYDFISRIHNS